MEKYIPPNKRNNPSLSKSKLSFDSKIDKRYMLTFFKYNMLSNDTFDTIEIKPLLMDAIYLEYLLNNNKIYSDENNNIKIIDSVNLVKRTIKGKYIDRRGKVEYRKPTNVVRVPSEKGDEIKLISDEYLSNNEQSKTFKLNTSLIDKSIEYYKNIIYYLIFKTFNYFEEEKYDFSDIHFTDYSNEIKEKPNEIKEKPNIIIKYLNETGIISDSYIPESKYIVVGYPDYSKMINYNNMIYSDNNYFNEKIQEKIITKINEQLIKKFHNLTTSDSESIFTDEEIINMI